MTPSENVITPEIWRVDSSVGESVRNARTLLLRMLAKTNNCESIDKLLDLILADKITPYTASLVYVNSLRTQTPTLKPSTIVQYRSMLHHNTMSWL